VEIIADAKKGEVKHERTGAVAVPAFPYTHGDLPPTDAPRREQLARWIASKENPYFAKSYVNRLWSYLLGVGLIDPVDDIRAGNPPSNPKLLDRLTQEFLASGFNTRHMIRTICKSRVYQQSVVTTQWNQDDDINYSHAIARRLPAEVLYDAIHRATGSVAKLPGLPAGARAAQLLDSSVPVPGGFLELFGKPPRESACECERAGGLMLGPVLGLINGPVLADAIKDPNNRLAKLVARHKEDAKLVEEIYLAVLCRLPTEAEREDGLKALREAEEEYPRLVEEYERRLALVTEYEQQLPAKQAEWEKRALEALSWTVLEPAVATATGGTILTKQPDSSLLASGSNPTTDTYVITASTKLTGITGVRLEVLPDPSLPAKGPGRAPNGNFVLSEFRVMAKPQEGEAKPRPVPLQNAKADFSQVDLNVAQAIDNNPGTGWAVAPQFGKKHVAVFETRRPLGYADGTTLTLRLEHRSGIKDHTIGRLRLSVTTAKPPFKVDEVPETIAKILAVAADERTAEQAAEVAKYYRSIDGELAKRKQAVDEFGKPGDKRLLGAQDLAWALINSPAFLFNH
jgi:hypothetical protein